MEGSAAHQTSAAARVRQQAIKTINALLGEEDVQDHQEALESLIAQVPMQAKYHEERIQQNIQDIKANLGGIYDLMRDLEDNLVEMSETQHSDPLPNEDSEMIDSIGQIWKIRSSVEFVKTGLESAIELESFAEELHNCQEALQATQLRQVLHQRSQILGLASTLPQSNHLRQTAQSIWDFIGTRLEEVFEPLLKEESNIYNPSTFGKEQVSTNLTGLSNSLADYFVVAFEANCTDKFQEAYSAKKLQILKKRMFPSKPGDSREYLTALGRLSQVLVRESTLLSNSAENIQTLNLGENDASMAAAFEKHVMRPYIVEFFRLFGEILEFSTAELVTKVTEELKREACQVVWRESWQLIADCFQQQKVLSCLTEAEARQVRAILAKPLESISRRTLAEVSETFESVAADKTKPTELDEKLQSIHFDQYAVALRYSLRLQCEQGFGLHLATWVQQASHFARSAAHKLQECLRVYERYYFGSETSLEGHFDPYLLLDRNRYRRTVIDAQVMQDIIKELPSQSTSFAAFSVHKKLMNSLLQIMINIFAEFLLFKNAIAELFGDLSSESPQHMQKGSLLSQEARQVLGLKAHCEADRAAAQGAVSILTHQLATIESDFKRDLLCLMLKDSRDSLARFFGQPDGVSSIQADLDRQAAGLASKLTQICEDHSKQQQESYFAARTKDWEGCSQDRPGVTQPVPLVENLTVPSPRAGVVYWLELYFTGLVCFFLLQVRTQSSAENVARITKALDAVKPTINKWVKYRVTNNSSS